MLLQQDTTRLFRDVCRAMQQSPRPRVPSSDDDDDPQQVIVNNNNKHAAHVGRVGHKLLNSTCWPRIILHFIEVANMHAKAVSLAILKLLRS